MKTALVNGKVYIHKNHFQEALLIENGIIKKVGTNEDIKKHSVDKIINLEGKTVIPAFNDSHLHLIGLGSFMNTLNLKEAKSIEEIIISGRKFIEKNKEIKALYGRGWNQDNFLTGEKRLLNRHDLDKISTEIPIVLDRVCGHLLVTNTKAIELAGVDENTGVAGGTIELGEDGKPNGIFTENAINLIYKAMPEKNHDIEKDFLKASKYAISLGITSVQSCDILNNDDYNEIFNIIHHIYDNKKTKLRYRHQYNLQNINYFKNYLETEFQSDKYDEKFLSKGALKLFKDGSLGARTALMHKDYEDAPGLRGVEALKDEELQDLVNLATEYGIQVVVHAIGDKAIDSVINAFEKTIISGKNKNNHLRHGIVHCQITNKKQLNRIAKLNIAVMFQPIFLDYDSRIVESRVGKKLASTSYAFNTLYNYGVHISFGTDAPVEDINPFHNIYCAVTRQRIDGNPKGGFYSEEKMDVQDAIDAYTIGSAYNEFKEDFKGRLKTGYVADLIVLSDDIFTIDANKIKDIEVEKTMIDGVFVYER